MILWLGGPFGVGKTTCAQRLVDTVPRARLHDPEALGWWLARTVGRVTGTRDYQELRVWRRGTVRSASWHARRVDLLVIPMTVLDDDHADELLGGLRARGHDVRHVTLHASDDVLRARIEADAVDPGARRWRLAQVDRWAEAAPRVASRGPVVTTDGRTPGQVADDVRRALEA
ncbi:AAA family ATPase [Cellulomonas gilvus]|uniref:Uncharacterized protein n=1 Tax=Cellulomonas gilvus (strain ATCC 13127 / NRRL B-14078) TaxID=593907 RepID=F8A0C3_CELGA|nr:AAA family ATPase [Cellulomonas gilvus]AEI11467.1 hypothetical protein Celgi_0948 [Cellulomonas gilvus ATCC 13127]